jgi:AcrR family transcriptional regulator
MTATSGAAVEPQLDASRGERTRSAILDASRRLFLERGYAGTPINAITEACGISRAGFYTYFKDKREIFNELGNAAYREALAVIAEWAESDEPFGAADISAWVGHYFDYMDHHGAFVLASAHSAPDDDAFRKSRNRMVTRASWKLGQAIAGDGRHRCRGDGPARPGLVHSAQTDRGRRPRRDDRCGRRDDRRDGESFRDANRRLAAR